MASKVVVRDGVVHGVYDDRLRWLYELLGGGQFAAERVSEVEYDQESGDWVARLLSTGEVVARGKIRANVIRDEVAYLEREVIR